VRPWRLPLILPLLLISACAEVEPPGGGADEATSISVIDDAGRTVTLEAPAERVVACAPDAAEVVCALDPAALVGRSRYTDYPPELTGLPVVGDFSSIDVERAAALTPELVVLAGLEQEPTLAGLEALGLTAYVHFPESLDDLSAAYERLGELLGVPGRAGELTAELTSARERLAERRPTRSPRVYLEISAAPLMAACAGSLQHDLLTAAGCENAFADLPRAYHRVEPEELLAADPEIVLLLSGIGVEEAEARAGWSGMSAVRDGRVHALDPDLFSRAGPRIVQALDELGRIVSAWSADTGPER
jgi:iron complex transport system substrate-binding protein